jgi:hypothetical protein
MGTVQEDTTTRWGVKWNHEDPSGAVTILCAEDYVRMRLFSGSSCQETKSQQWTSSLIASNQSQGIVA